MLLKTVSVLANLLVLSQSKPHNFIITKRSPKELVENLDGDIPKSGPTISKFHVSSNIQFRYAHTRVVSYVKNPSSEAEEISFTAVIPDSAFMSNFSMVLQGKEYVAEVKPKEEAKKEYEEAVSGGYGAGLVSQDARDANKFTVATNVEAGQKVEFRLTYEELLERKLGQYEHAINVNPGQVVNDFRIEVFINESLPIKSLNVPELKESNDIDFEENKESEIAKVDRYVDGEASKAHVTFAPDRVYQEEAGEQGLSGQFLVQYDVDRSGQDNEVQVIDGYFVHYFTPENLPTLPKHVIFVLDTSGSMAGEKINQLKDAMFTILDDMTDKDFFNIVTFSSGVSLWDPKSGTNFGDYSYNFDETTPETPLQQEQFVIEATEKNKNDAIKYVIDISANGGTNINEGLLEGLKIAKFAKQNEKLPGDTKSLIVFLSDGQASSGLTFGNEIKSNVKAANDLNVPIYSLGFGGDADFDLIKDISASADAFSKQIYEGSDAAIQLENFFAEISSPLLSNLKFQYVGGLVDKSSVSDPQVRTFFKGGEFVVAGQLDDPRGPNDVIDVTVTADGRNGEQYLKKLQICLNPAPEPTLYQTNSTLLVYPSPPISCIYPAPPSRSQAQNFLQRLYAFLNIKQLLKKADQLDDETDDVGLIGIITNHLNKLTGKETLKEKALKLALDNNFVTELTSLVVIRPQEEPKISNLKESRPDSSHANVNRNYISYAAPSGSGYGSISGYSAPSPSYGAPASGYGAPSASGYGAPSASGYGAPASGYGAPATGYSSAPAPAPAPSGFFSSVQNSLTNLIKSVPFLQNSPPQKPAYKPPPPPKKSYKPPRRVSTPATILQSYGAPAAPLAYQNPLPLPAYKPPPMQSYAAAAPPVYQNPLQLSASTTPAPATDVSPVSCSGNITLFSKTYLRGENMMYSEDTEDLADFDDKLVSVEVKGNCCWTVFTDVGYGGATQVFKKGKYTSLVQVGDVFREGSSLRRSNIRSNVDSYGYGGDVC